MDVSPSDAVDEEDVPDDPTDADTDSSGSSISDMLLSTEPDESPDSYSTQAEIAHLLIAAKKMMNGAGKSVKSGTTALENIVLSGVGFLSGGESNGSEDGSDGSDAV